VPLRFAWPSAGGTTPACLGAEEREGDAGGGDRERGEGGVGEAVAAGAPDGEDDGGGGGRREGEGDDAEAAAAGGEEVPRHGGEDERGEGEDQPGGEGRRDVEGGGRGRRDDEEAVDPPGGAEEGEGAEAEVVERCLLHAPTVRFRNPLRTPRWVGSTRDVRTASLRDDAPPPHT
jgi:hypothetical protein